MSKHASASEVPDESVNPQTEIEAFQSSPEFRGPVEPLDDHDHANDHFALIYESREEQFAAAVPFIQQGLERGERCLYVTHENAREDVVAAMQAYGIDVDAALDSGALSIHDEEEVYLRNETFDAEETIEFLDAAIEEATEEYEALRITGEMSGVLPGDPEGEDLVRCEAKANYLFDDVDGLALCQYNRERFPSDVIRDVISTHPFLVHDNRVSHNVYYTPPEEFFDPETSDREVDRRLKALREQTDTRDQLQQREQYLRESYEITSDPVLGFEEKLQALFELGCDQFGLELGAMAEVDPETDRFEVEHVSDDHEQFEPGLELPLSETYCTAATDAGGIGNVDDPVEAGYDDIHVYREFDIRAYLGTYIEVEGDANRTFFFVSEEPREGGFSDAERTFQRLMGQWVKYELERQQRERELRDRKQHLSALVETTPECIKTVADDGTLLQMNSAGLDMVQAGSDSDVIGECVYDLIAPEHRERFRDFNERICRGERGTLEFDIVGLEGRRLHMESHAAPLRHPDGTISHVALTRDVTEQKKREQALRETKEQLRALIDVLPVAVFVAEDDGEIVEWNEAAEDIWGGRIVKSESVDEYEQYDGWWADTGESVEPDEWPLARALDGEAVTDPDEIEIEGFDGERRTVLNHGMPVRDADGEVSRAVVTLVDITEQKERERDLEQYETVAETASDVILTIDDDGRIQNVNPAVADVFGYEPAALEGEPLTTLMPDRFAADHRAGFAQYLQTGERTLDWEYIELPGVRADGTEIPLAISFSEYVYDGEHYFTGIVRDITEREEREAELQQTKDRFETVFEQSDDAIFLLDSETDEHVDANPAACQKLGYTCDELLSTSPSELHPDETDQFRAFIDTVREDGSAWTEDLHYRTADGRDLPAEVTASTITLDGRDLVLANVRHIEERKKHERFQRELYDAFADAQASFDEKIEDLLELGRERFGLEVGYFTQTDDDAFEIVTAVGDHDQIRSGVTNSLRDTYCEKLLASTEPISVQDAAEMGWVGDPAYDQFGLDAYFATTIRVGAEEYGTLCFASETPRREPFSDAERTFLDLMGQLVEYELERRRRERFLRESYQITADPALGFEEKVEQLLDLGREWMGLDAAGLTHLPSHDGGFLNEYTVGYGDDSDGEVWTHPGEGCYCREAITRDEPVGMADVRGTEWADDQIYQEHGLTCYLGTKVTNGSAPYGTLWVGSTEPRDREFTETERTFLELIGQWVSYEIEQREHSNSQRKLYEITADPELATDEKIDRLLKVGSDRLGLPLGMVNRDYGAALEVQQMHGDHPTLYEGAFTPSSSDHYCREVVDTGDPLTVTDAKAAGWSDDPHYEESGLETYAGVPVTVGDNTYGTLCFADTSPREAFSEAEQAFLDLVGQCVGYELDQSHREIRLHMLNAIGRELLDAEARAEIAEGVAETVEDAFETPVAAVALYDDDTGELRPAARTDAAAELVETAGLFDGPDGGGWNAFVENETKRVTDPLDRGDADVSRQPPVSEAVVHPLGNHGVFVVGTRSPNGFRCGDAEVIETSAANIRAALDRTDRECKLQEREQALEEQNETLARLNRINDTIRRLDQALVEASSRDEIERVVCEELADSGPYELAWIGDDSVTNEVTPTEWAGAEKGYLDDITITSDDRPEGRGPTGRAITTGEPQVVNNVLQDESFEPWRQDALNRGYHAIAALPLTYDDTRYGVLNLYASQPAVFDSLEREVLTELSNTVGHAINAIESKKALVSDSVTELEFAVEDSSLGAVDLARELDCEFSLQRLVPQSDGSVRAFFSIRGAPAADVLEYESRLTATDLRLISDGDDDSPCLFEATLTEKSLSRRVLNHGGRLQTIHVEDGTATVVVHLAAEADVREFSEMLLSKYPESELRAQRSQDLPQQTALEFVTALIEDLTDRQEEALQMAYFNGYFEEPRTQTASEIAASMDISQPTFNSHLRTALRKICQKIYKSDSVSA